MAPSGYFPALDVPSSFGPGAENANASANTILDSERFRELDRRQAYYDCTQHDYKTFDFDGRAIAPGKSLTQPLLASEAASWYVPLKQRRPSSPYRLARVIVNAFTNLLFGEQRFPVPNVEGDSTTQDFVQTCVTESKLPTKMLRARAIGGSVGTVGLSWCFYDGKPRVEVHNGKHLFVHEWADRDELVPSHVTEVFRYTKTEFDREKKKYVLQTYWHRKDWTPMADVVFKPVQYKAGKDPMWEADEDKTVIHNDECCHFVWIQNLPNDDEDGLPDYEGLYENCDTLDLLYSALQRGTLLNLDPTLVLKMDPDLVNHAGVSKGSDSALAVGEAGDAHYLEMTGSGITVGLTLFESKRRSALEVAECVIPDPNVVAAQGTSSVAMKMLYAPMLCKTSALRDQYGQGIVRLLNQMLEVAKRRHGELVLVLDDEGNATDGEAVICLPPRIEKIPILDPDSGLPTGDENVVLVEREPGSGNDVTLKWGDYFPATADDRQKECSTLVQASGGKPLLSEESAVKRNAVAFGLDPNEEWLRISKEKMATRKMNEQMMAGGTGGEVEQMNHLPEGAAPLHPEDTAPFDDAPAEPATE